MFSSRITGESTLGIAIKTARSSGALLAQARQAEPVCVLLDLANPGLILTELVRRNWRNWASTRRRVWFTCR